MSDDTRLVIWGAGGHALVVADLVRLRGAYQIVGFLDDLDPCRAGQPFANAYVLGGVEQLDRLAGQGVRHTIIAIGDCQARLRRAAQARDRGLIRIMAIHPQAIIAPDVVVGPGTVVAAGAVVSTAAQIGNDVIINTAATVDHECLIDDGAHIGPGVHLGGRVRVGRGAWIGIGATVVDRVQIGSHALIGAGAVVLKDVPAGMVAYGVPARVVRRVEADVE